MNILRFFSVLLFFSLSVHAQIGKPRVKLNKPGGIGGIQGVKNDTLNNMKDVKNNIKNYPVEKYKIFTIKNDTVSVDTTLTVRNLYKYNYLFKDDFLRLDFSNIAHAYNSLSYDSEQNENVLPGFVATAKTGYVQHDEINFYKVPSPYSDLSYQNGVSQGQLLKAFMTANINPDWNVSAGYRGISSLGIYKNNVVSAGRFFGSTYYQYKKYKVHLYYVTHDISNEENAGIKDINQFENGGDTFKDRSRIDVNITDAKNLLKGKRLFLGQQYKLFDRITLVDKYQYHQRSYEFEQSSPAKIIDSAMVKGKFKDSVFLQQIDNFAGVKLHTKHFQLQTGLRYIYQFYSFDSIKDFSGNTYPKFLIYNDLSVDSDIKFNWKKIAVQSKLNFILTQNMQGYYFDAKLKYRFNDKLKLQGNIISSSIRPDYRFILYQSAYYKYNWYNPDFKNQLSQEIKVNITHKKWGKLLWQQNILNNYTYFGLDSLPKQSTDVVAYSGLQYSNDFHYKKLGLSTDIRLQSVLNGKDVLSLPAYVVRASFYYSNHYFKRNLFVQTGITAKYFESFYANAYNPVLSDFLIQRTQKIGGYPLLNYFINFKVKRFRFFFKMEHFNALWEYKKPGYYAAPLQPIRDFNIRFGVRWIFFN